MWTCKRDLNESNEFKILTFSYLQNMNICFQEKQQDFNIQKRDVTWTGISFYQLVYCLYSSKDYPGKQQKNIGSALQKASNVERGPFACQRDADIKPLHFCLPKVVAQQRMNGCWTFFHKRSICNENYTIYCFEVFFVTGILYNFR